MSVALVPGGILAQRYRLDRMLGEGGMGLVWAATHEVTRKAVALKFLKPASAEDPAVRQRFLREARAACAVQHPNVVPINDVLELDDGSPVIVMDLLKGETLAARLARSHRLQLAEAARILLPVISAVGTAHALGIVHRDLKPDNLFLEDIGNGAVEARVLDFGIAKLTAIEGDAAQTGGLTQTGSMMGTPYYMSPEQAFGEKDIDHRADIWSLGVILYECLAGVRPTQADSMGQILKIVMTGIIEPLQRLAPETPEDISALVGRMLSRERERRPADLREVVETLRRYADVSIRSFGVPLPASKPAGHAEPGHKERVSAPNPIGFDPTLATPRVCIPVDADAASQSAATRPSHPDGVESILADSAPIITHAPASVTVPEGQAGTAPRPRSRRLLEAGGVAALIAVALSVWQFGLRNRSVTSGASLAASAPDATATAPTEAVSATPPPSVAASPASPDAESPSASAKLARTRTGPRTAASAAPSTAPPPAPSAQVPPKTTPDGVKVIEKLPF